MVKLSDRLERLASYVKHGSVAADIGTDHALLPAFLIREGICERVIATDLHPGPLAAARSTVQLYKLETSIEVREGDGLQALRPGEVDQVIIAGMGGVRICDILDAAPLVLRRLKGLVLQPLGGIVNLRSWLCDNGWLLSDEDLVLDDGRFYVIIVAEPQPPGAGEPEFKGIPCCESFSRADLLEIGPRLLEKNHPLLIPYLQKQLHDMEVVAKTLDRARTPSAKVMQRNWYQKIEFYRKVIACQSARS